MNVGNISLLENVVHTPVHHVSTMLYRKRSSFDLSEEKFKMRTILDIVKIVKNEGLKYLCEFFALILVLVNARYFQLSKNHWKAVD